MAVQTYREAVRDAMAEEMRRNADVFLIGEEVAQYQGAYKCSQGMLDEFGPNRVVDTPISELGFTGLACGAAMMGLRPVVEFMTWNFAMLAADHIVNTAGKTLYMSGGKANFPMVFRGLNGVAARVAAQHTQDYASWYGRVPGLKVVTPATPADAKGLLKAAIRDNNPVLCLENEVLYGMSGEVPEGEHILPIGKAAITRPGKDVTIIAYSIMANKALEAAKQLEKDGIDAEVIDLRAVRPLDEEALVTSVQKTHRVVVATEDWAFTSIASEITAILQEKAFDELDAPITRVCGADVPMPYAATLEKLAVPQVEDIISAARKVCYL